MELISRVTNKHDAGIVDKVSIRPKPEDNKFLFFSTGSYNLLSEGIVLDNLNMQFDPERCKKYLIKKLMASHVIKSDQNIDILVYLSGGIPFLKGTLNDLYSTSTPHFKRYIYGVLTRPIEEKDLNKEYPELCDISNGLRKLLLSPICDSSLTGLCDIACLLGYLNHDGMRGDKLLKSAAAVIRFPPFIMCLNRIINRDGVTGRDIVTVCSTFHTYFTFLINSVILPDKIFEYALRCCNIITHISNIPKDLPIKECKLNSKEIQFWANDCGENFGYVELEPFNPKSIEDANKSFASFTPIAPLSVRVATGCSIIKGKDHTYLCLQQSPIKESTNLYDIINPIEGKVKSLDIELFAKIHGNLQIDTVANLIDQNSVKQIIYVCFDQSSSMNGTLDGEHDFGTDEPSRNIIATQYLMSFANRSYSFRIPCILGLISFNHELTLRCPLSPLIPDFEEKGLKNIESQGTTHLWDAISFACNELIKYSTDNHNNSLFPNAIYRILVISDGEDVESQLDSVTVVKSLLKNKIILDYVAVSSTGLCKELAVISHITGGLAFNPKDVNQGMEIFEKSAFLETKERKKTFARIIKDDPKTSLGILKPENITQDFIQKAIDCIEFDTKIESSIELGFIKEKKMRTPKSFLSIEAKEQHLKTRYRRILRELHYAALVMDKENLQTYDPDLIILPFQRDISKWKVFLKSPECPPYNGKWFFLGVIFSEFYPIEAPDIRFISIPYNLNVSTEGRICLNVIEKGYIPSFHVVDIIQQIKSIFLIPNEDTPIRLDILSTFKSDEKKYNKLAAKSAQEVGKDDYNDFIPNSEGYEILDDDKFVLTYNESDSVPSYLKSQISGRIIKDRVIPPSVGIPYDREELRQLVSSSNNPICIVTGKPITETLEQIDLL